MKTPGYFVAAAGLAKLAGTGCGDNLEGNEFLFAEGVASGDPRQTSVVLWTRVSRSNGKSDPVAVTVQVSESNDFVTLVLEETVTVSADSDHTLRMVVTELTPGTPYFYRFVAGSEVSVTGQTLTAPPADDDKPVRLAWVSCQDISTGFFGAYREIIKNDEARPPDERIQFVVHLGDFIYETRKGGFQIPLDTSFQPVTLTDRQGRPRELAPFPSGGGDSGNEGTFAQTLDDYRHIYRSFLSDPDLQAARARWPFIVTWDDHEFTNDAWQTQANYTLDGSLDEASQTRKLAGNQAWFEYIPAHLTGATGVDSVTQAAADFKPATVSDTAYSAGDVDDDYQLTDSDSRAAIDSMTIYRSFRFGKHVELVITDERSYRSDHPVPEEIVAGTPALFFDARAVMPFDLVNVLDQGKTANGGNPPDQVSGFTNPRKASPPGTMLGPAQKAWWKETMQKSDATWKVWGNQVPFMRFLINNPTTGILIYDRLMATDAWDGYNSERKELMTFLRDNSIDNVVIITGDIHAHFAGLVMDDFDAQVNQPVSVELCAAGVTSNSMFSFFENAVRAIEDPSLPKLVTYDAPGGGPTYVENINALLRHGSDSALAAASTHSLADILAAKDPTVNPHLRYVDSNAQGFGLLTVTADQVIGELVTVNRPISDNPDGPGIRRSATFTIDKGQLGNMAEPTITGTLPFPLDLPTT